MAYTLYMHPALIEPPEGLLQRIMTRIRAEERRLRAAKINLFLCGGIGLLSLTALIPAYQAMEADIAASGLSCLLLLTLSDTAIITLLWKEFTLSLLESVPTISIIAMLAVLLICISSFRIIFKKINFTRYEMA